MDEENEVVEVEEAIDDGDHISDAARLSRQLAQDAVDTIPEVFSDEPAAAEEVVDGGPAPVQHFVYIGTPDVATDEDTVEIGE